ncbi:MAG: hypothetical protein WC489_01215 [Patescibacteria group bacterium]
MAAKQETGVQRGNSLIELLKDKGSLKASFDQVMCQTRIGDQTHKFTDGTQSDSCSFIPFPQELRRAFPGTYISPTAFLHEMGFDGNEKNAAGVLTGEQKAHDKEHPVFTYFDKSGQFSLTVTNGAFNEDALDISHIARKHGYSFADPQSRLEYQTHLLEGAKHALDALNPEEYGIILHDDCMASADTMLGYLLLLIKKGDHEKLKKGVKIVIDGPATVQSILLLQRLGEAYDIKLNITANWLSFGLSQGDEGGNHANYVTAPGVLIGDIENQGVKEKLGALLGGADEQQVVSDMGNAGAKIPEDTLVNNELLQTLNSKRVAFDELYKIFASGAHMPEYVIFPRGGEWSVAALLAVRPDLAESLNISILRANRVGNPDDGYGLMIEEKPEQAQ